MWPVRGKPVDPRRFQPLVPSQVLYDFEGPRTFTYQDQDGELYLVHWCDEDHSIRRYLVVPFAERLVAHLLGGELSVREALEQPRVWLLDVNPDDHVMAAWRVELTDIPADALPQPGTMLLPTLDRQSLRPVEKEIPEGSSLQFVGRIRELDKDQLTFELRNVEGDQPARRFAFQANLLEDVFQAFQEDYRVLVVGVDVAADLVRAVAISRARPAA